MNKSKNQKRISGWYFIVVVLRGEDQPSPNYLISVLESNWPYPNDLLMYGCDLKNWQIIGLSPSKHSSNISFEMRKVVEITQDFLEHCPWNQGQ